MRTKRATKHNAKQEHNQYGIYNWFRNKGITHKDIIRETIHNFCQDNGYDMNGFDLTKGGQEVTVFNWVSNRFKKFAPYASQFLKNNNYV